MRRVDTVVAGRLDLHVWIPSDVPEVLTALVGVLSMTIVGRRQARHSNRPRSSS